VEESRSTASGRLISAHEAEGQMSGYMVAVEAGGRRDIYMVREPDAKKACDQVSRMMGNCPTSPLTPVPVETLDYFQVPLKGTFTVHTHQCDEVICCHEMA
jgi:hypothetical protein